MRTPEQVKWDFVQHALSGDCRVAKTDNRAVFVGAEVSLLSRKKIINVAEIVTKGSRSINEDKCFGGRLLLG
jgi:hypothetical protein